MIAVSPLPRRRLAALLVASVALATHARGQSSSTELPPARITSDTPEFCSRLAERLRQKIRAIRPEPVPDEVVLLEQEGLRMCHEGHVRPGILRIRQALMILRQS